MVVAAQHVRDVHLDVVDRIGEEEHGRAVRADDHEIDTFDQSTDTSPCTTSSNVLGPRPEFETGWTAAAAAASHLVRPR
jgi:hypothetical protein